MTRKRLRVLLMDGDQERRQGMVANLYEALHCPTVITAIGRDAGDLEQQVLQGAEFDVGVLSLEEGESPLLAGDGLHEKYGDLPIIAVGGELAPRELQAQIEFGMQNHIPRRCTDCDANHRLPSSIAWTVERERLQSRIRQMHQEREQMALRDQLTGLPNRKLFLDRLNHLVQRQARTGKGFALLFVDLDRFKGINDTLGHEMGDQLLVEVAGRLEQCIRVSDTCARWGGDEFLVSLEGTESRRDAERVASKIVESLACPFSINGTVVAISGCIGISLCPTHASVPGDLIRQADIAMYRAKAGGGNAFRCFRGAMARLEHEG